MMNESSLSPGKPPSRRGLYLPFILLGALFLGWSLLWLYLAHRAGTIADGFVLREGERGRDWICPDREIVGYPFRIEIRCKAPRVTFREQDGLRHEGSLGGLIFHARILAPGHFIATFLPPFRARHGEAGEMDLGWKSARASLKAGNEGIGEFSFELAEPVLAAGPHGREDVRVLAKGFELHLRRSPGEKTGTDLVARVTDMTFAPFDALMGNNAPIRFEFQASAPGLVADPGRRFQDIVEEWRLANGQARVILAQITKGQANIDLSGVMGLDSERRLEGNLQGRAKGLDALGGLMGRRGGLDLGGVLGKMSGGQGLPVALTFQNGRARFGPFPLFELAPLY